VIWSAVIFLLPVAAGIVGAALVQNNVAAQWTAGSAGFVLGFAVAWLLNRAVNRTAR